jgi:hypothetical protein
MAVSKQEVIFEFNADTGDVDKSVVDLGKKLDRLTDSIELMAEEFSKSAKAAEEVAEAADEAAEATEDIGENAKKSGGLLKKAGSLGAQGFKLVGAAIAATGLLGLVQKVLQPIIEAFFENKKVADTLGVAMAGIGTVIDTIIDLTGPLIEKLSAAFTDPKQAVIDLKDAIVENIETRIDGLLNLFPRLGEAIKAAFSGDFAGAAKIATDAVGQVVLGVEDVTDKVTEFGEEFVETIQTNVASATALEAAMQRLLDRERDLSVATAQASAEVEELKRQRDDERLSIEERIAAAEAAAEIDQRLADENVAIAEEKARLLREEIALQGETEERLQELADAEIAAADARAASTGVQTELMTSIYGLNQEVIDQENEIAAMRREFTSENLEGIEAERQAIEDQLTDRIAAIDKLKISEEEKTQLILEATASRDKQLEILEAEHQAELLATKEAADAEAAAKQKELDDAEQARRDKELADAEALAQAKLDVTKSSLDALLALNDAFAGDSEQEQRKAFERSKKIQTAQALISTYESAVQAFKSLAGIPVVGPALGSAAAAAAVASGLANVKAIQSQTFGGGGGEPDVPETESITASATAGGGSLQTPTLDLSFLGQGAGQAEPIQAYVLAENVSTAQQANQKIQDQATL